jgi:hypothetical protein
MTSNIEIFKTFRSHFSSKYFDIIANDNLQKVATFSKLDLFTSPHILFYGNDPTLLRMIVDTIISKIFQEELVKKKCAYELTNNNNKYSCSYSYSKFHTEIDIESVLSAERQFISEFISGHIASTKNILQEKHIVVIHNINSLNENTMYALRYPIERLSNNVFFIFTSKTITGIEPALLSRCMPLRCNISIDNMEQFFEAFVENNNIEDIVEIDPNDNILCNVLKLTKNDSTDNLHKKLHAFIDDIAVDKSIGSVCEKIRTFGYKILHFNVSIATIFKIVIKYASQHKLLKKHIYHIVQLSANLQLKDVEMSKPILLFERYFMEIYRLLSVK